MPPMRLHLVGIQPGSVAVAVAAVAVAVAVAAADVVVAFVGGGRGRNKGCRLRHSRAFLRTTCWFDCWMVRANVRFSPS